MKGKTCRLGGLRKSARKKAKDAEIERSRLIDVVNERCGTDFTQADELFFHPLRKEVVSDAVLRQAATANTMDSLRYVSVKAQEGSLIGRMEQSAQIFAKYSNDAEFRKVVWERLLKDLYERVRKWWPGPMRRACISPATETTQ